MSPATDTPFSIRELATGIYALETQFWGKGLNLYLFKGERTLLCDPGAAGMPTTLVLPKLEEAGLIDNGIDFLINAHSHIDHYGGNAEIKARFPGIVIMAHANELDFIADAAKQYSIIYDRWPGLFEFGNEFRDECIKLGGVGTRPDIGLQGGEIINLGGITLTVVNLFGHSFGDIGVYDAQYRRIFFGESLLGEGARDDSGEIVGPTVLRKRETYEATLGVIKSLDVNVLGTSHCGVLEGQAIARHLAESVQFFTDYENNVADVVSRGSTQGVTAEEAARRFADDHSPFEFRLETMQLVSSHLALLQRKGRVRKEQDRYVSASAPS